MSAPAWADDLVATVCADAGVPPPRLLWRVRRGGPSTGVARRSDGTIPFAPATDPLDQRLTLLHELAHWLAPAARRRGLVGPSRPRLLRVAFDLYRRHGLDDADALRWNRRATRSALAMPSPSACRAPPPRSSPTSDEARRARPRRNGASSCPSIRSGSSATGAGQSARSAVSGWSGRICARVRRSRRAVRHVLMTAVA